ncbi:hypothetical protein SDC9_146708 [bioreactor metagenome]|uniref:Uncharacterized protein n=1 Tax=bioreactor metagenome TaxID=1076179 RepID=A0A645ECT4_9ZZZZ
MTEPMAWARAERNAKNTPIRTTFCGSSLLGLPRITQATPKRVMSTPNHPSGLMRSPKKRMASTTVIGGAKMEISRVRRGPMEFSASKYIVSPKPMPSAPLTRSNIKAKGVRAVGDSLRKRLISRSSRMAPTPLMRFSSVGRMDLPNFLKTKLEIAQKSAAEIAASSPEKRIKVENNTCIL